MTNTERLIWALEYALELQGAVENHRPHGYGSPASTTAWMENARDILDLVKKGGYA